MHMWGTYVPMHTKYEVSMSDPVPGGGVHRLRRRQERRWTKYDCIRLFG